MRMSTWYVAPSTWKGGRAVQIATVVGLLDSRGCGPWVRVRLSRDGDRRSGGQRCEMICEMTMAEAAYLVEQLAAQVESLRDQIRREEMAKGGAA
jgi:hypothetical protein